MRRPVAALLLAGGLALAGCGALDPYPTAPRAEQPGQPAGRRVAICYNALTAPRAAVEAEAQRECAAGTVAQPDALRLMLPAGSERRILVRTSALRLAAKAVSVANKAAELRAIAGRNRVSIETPNGRLSVDLEGKAHFDKTRGRYVDTPHVKFDTRHVGPDGRVSYTSGSVREATHADLRLVARVLAKRGR